MYINIHTHTCIYIYIYTYIYIYICTYIYIFIHIITDPRTDGIYVGDADSEQAGRARGPEGGGGARRGPHADIVNNLETK